MKTLIPLLVLLVAVSGCRESRQETARDVADAKAQGTEDVREARADQAEVEEEVAADRAMPGADDRPDARPDVALAKAQATLDVEQERCEAMTGAARNTCKDVAKAVYDKAVAEADLARTRELAAAQPGSNNTPAP